MEANSFLPPPNFSFDAKDWPSWKQRFSQYRLLPSLNAKEQEYQITALIYLMGERAEEIHSAFNLSANDAKNLDKVIEAFDNHFIGKHNVVYERALFGLRSQWPEETIEEFVTVLHRKSEHCEYANLREELIRDRLVLGVKDRKLLEKLMLNENLTLAKAVEIVRQWEAVMREQQDLNPSTLQVDTMWKVAKQKPKASGHGKDNGRSTDKCPAKDKVCGKCGKKGHYTNLCRRKYNEVNAISSEETPAREKVSFVYAVREPTLGSRKSRWKSTVRVNGTAIHFKLDPDSDVTLIPFSLYKRYFSNVQLTPTDGQLMAAANQRLENDGTFVAKLRANTREMKEAVYVVDHLEQPLLGVGACEDLQLIKRIDLVIKGTTDPYHIKLKEGAKPFSIPVPRRVPIPLMPKLKEQLDAMVAQEVIEPVDEPTEWCAPIVLAGKPNGKIRICVDLFRLNLSVERELHPLPVLEHELAHLNGAKIFSRLDANSGFWQISLKKAKRGRLSLRPLADINSKGFPLGSLALQNTSRNSCLLSYAESMGKVPVRCKQRYIDEHGIKADEKKVKAIAEMKPPTDVHGVQRFMGMVNFLGRFVPNLAEITKPLNDLRKKDVSFIWGSPQKKAFEKVKEVLASDRVLTSFDISKKTMVSADASSYGLGAVLKQEHKANEWRPVAFASRMLMKTEQGYAQIEKEALAITWACERFKDFVVGKTFLIETDHKPLVSIFTTKDLNDLTPRLQRYRMRMLQFSFRIFHTPGKDLITADTLSRQPLPGHLPEDEELQEEVEHFVRSIVLHQSTTDDRLAKIALNQKLEPTLQNVAFYSKNGWPAKCQLSPLERSFYDVRDEIGEENGLLMRGLGVIIPSNMRKDVLNRIHAGHQGITKCRARAKDHVWWPGIGQEIQDMVKTCEKCIENQPLKHEPLIPNDFLERPWQKVGMDLFHYEGSEYLVVVDYFSRFIEVVRLTKLSSEAVVDHCKAIFARHGIPDIVISDNGPQFCPSTTSAFTKFASEVGFRHITSSPKHPQSNDQAEAAVKIVKSLMKKNKDPVLALMEYRATPLAKGLSPAELLFGRKIRTMGGRGAAEDGAENGFDRCHAATKKAELIAGEKVWVKDLRAWGSVIEKASAPRSYIVKTPVETYRRYSLLLASSQQQVDPSETSPDSELLAETEETPGNELPADEQQQLPAIAPEMKQLSPSPGKVSRHHMWKAVRFLHLQEEQDLSAQFSSQVNKSYQQLQNPLSRAEYLLELQGQPTGEGQQLAMDPGFLAEMMEFNETLAEGDQISPETLDQLRKQNDSAMAALVQQLSKFFSANKLEAAAQALAQLRYHTNLDAKIKGLQVKIDIKRLITSGINLFNVPEADEEFEDYFLADSGSELDDSIEDPQFTLEGLESDTTEIYHEESEEEQIRQPTPEDEGWTEVRLPLEKPTFSGTSGPKAAFFPGTLSPYSVFKQFFDEELFRTIKLETNKYARMVIDKERKKGPLNPRGLLAKWKAVSIAELKIFLAIIIHMSLVVKPRLREYWSNHIGMRTAFCKSTGMARERFEAILSMLHLNDNMLYIPHGQPGYDPIYKIRTLFDSLVNKFRTWYSPDEKLTIDEAICPFRGRVHFRVYIKGKPHKYGIKIYEICESSTGYTCNLDIYTGRHPHQDLQYNSILSLVDRIAEPYYQKGHIIYFDRWFSSPQLFNHLWEKKTLAVGTVRHNRKGLPKKAFSKKLKKGESIFCQNSQLLALKWRDTRDVFMIATTQDSSMIQAQKKIRRQPQTISITKPAIVVDYNKNKAGVDRSDQFMAYYPFHRRTLKWWKKLFFHIFGLTIVNSHIVYNKLTTGRKMPLREYHLAIMERLMEEAGTEILDEQPSASGSSERLIGKHFLTKIPATGKTTIQKRCKVCSDKGKRSSGKRVRKDTSYMCETCLVPLCIADCFKAFHTKERYWE
ncbi:K02A2.6-like [Cordylochernes scorpioides]|uniref:RNA-directed DNA polymerase n=1 Tax=Cordylochernes scorpioides TaxID=51811 RepID=A0ABY6KG25_9ARAC|nr:K02A2.6-like [Cordylochernes scorpioides]